MPRFHKASIPFRLVWGVVLLGLLIAASLGHGLSVWVLLLILVVLLPLGDLLWLVERILARWRKVDSARPWRYSRALTVDQSTRIAANTEKQNYTVVPETAYSSMKLACDRCGEEFWFSANEQVFWYEELGFWIDSIPKQCVKCRKLIRQERSRRSGAQP